MDAFCGSPFWDYNLSWNTTDPSLTPCFQKTALVWIPCSYLWLFTPLEIAFIRRYQKRPLKWNTLNLSKTIFMIMLMTTQIVDFSYILNKNINEAKVYPVYFYTPIIKFCTFILCFFLTILGFKKGKHTSGVLIIFWFMFTLSSSVKFISLIKEAVKTHSISQLIPFITYCIFYVSLFGELISSSISDVSPSVREAHIRENRSPEETASFWSKISFGWFDRFMWQGLRQPITYEGLWNLKDSVKTNSVCELFDPEWENELDKSKSTFDRLGRSTSREALLPVEIEPNSSASVIKALWKSFGISFIASTVLCTMGDFTILLSPIILKQLIGFVESHDPFWHGIFYVILLGIVGIIDSILFNEHTDLVNNLSLRMNSALMSAVYKKALKSSNSLKRTSTVGEFINLMSVDIERMSETLIYIPIVFTFPIKISIAVYLMWDLMGVSALIGLSVFFVLIPINTFIARQIEKMQVLIMELKDKRINITNEVLSGIKVIKLYAWELSFNDKISLIRKEELSIMKKMFWLNSFEWFLSNSSTLLISIITFATYILIDETHVLTATIAFVSVSLVKIIEEPLGYLTEMIQAIIQMRISIKRLNRYMSVEELDEDQIERTADESKKTILL